MSRIVDVAIVGAGPYGLSVAAHLAGRGIDARTFGTPMQTWAESMPVGMMLKSEGFASSLSAPQREASLASYCAGRGLPYADIGTPVPAETFTDYGRAFQQRYVPDLVQENIVSITPTTGGFLLTTSGGSQVSARQVVVASGIRPFYHVPPELRSLPSEFLSHSVDYGDAIALKGREVLVVGAGSSATDMAAHLRMRGARARIVTRRDAITFQTPLGERSLRERIKAPMTGLGPGWKSVLCVKAPLLFHAMPESFRVEVVRRYLGPAPGWYCRPQVEGHVPVTSRASLLAAAVLQDKVHLRLRGGDGEETTLVADHVVAATGYRVEIDRLSFLAGEIRQGLRLAGRAPQLSSHFESSIPGLYFVGTAAANSFGPLLRFVYGADFAARRVSSHLVRQLRRHPSAGHVPDRKAQEPPLKQPATGVVREH
ncbi:NAD(P)-binding domain-containing protein [Labrys neptuniae]